MRKKNKASRLLALLCSLAMVLSMMPLAGTVYADGPATTETEGVVINDTNFPDDAFREYVKQFDTEGDGDGTLSADEISSVTEIGGSQGTGALSGVSSLKGIEYFTSLTTLDCSDNTISTLTSLPASLTTLNCSGNADLAEVDVSSCTNLNSLVCNGCKVTKLTVNENKTLQVQSEGGGMAYITYADGPQGSLTATVETMSDSGHGLSYFSKSGDDAKMTPTAAFSTEIASDQFGIYTFYFEKITESFTNGQTFTRGASIPFTAKQLETLKPVSWAVNSDEGGDPIVSGNFQNSANSGTIDTSSLSPGAYDLNIRYSQVTSDPVAYNEESDEDFFVSYSISFNIEESHYTGPTYYYLNVENGSGDGTYTYNTRVDIEADPAPEGKEFDKWVKTSGEGAIENADAEKTVYTMGFGNATVTATYKDKKPAEPENAKYQLTVENGSGSGVYVAGTKVAIKADKPEKGKVFDKWILIDGKGLIKEKGSSNTVFTMEESDATVKAVYKKQTGTPAESDDHAKPDKPSKPDNQKGHDNPDNPQTGDTQMLFAWMTILAAATAGIYILNRKSNELEE